LKHLHIEDFVLIDRVSLDFGPGFSVLSGETGAGKSIIVTAVEILLGGRGDSLLVRRGARKARLEAVFDAGEGTRQVLAAEGADNAGGELLLRRDIGADGRSRCYANGRPVTVGTLAALTETLVELHGQFADLPALRRRGQTDLLDDFGGFGALRARYDDAFRRWQELRAARARLEASRAERDVLLDGLTFMINELEGAALTPGEEEGLKEKRDRLRYAARVAEDIEGALAILSEGDGAVTHQLATLKKHLGDLAEVVPSARGAVRRLEEAAAAVDDIAREVAALRADEDDAPLELDDIESRLAIIERLKRKYAKDVPALLAHLAELKDKKAELEGADDRLVEVAREAGAAAEEVAALAAELSTRRREAASALAAQVNADLPDLGMEGAAFDIKLEPPSGGTLAEAAGVVVGPRGAEEAAFELAANPGEELKPLSRVASGGELSRVMLAVRAASAARAGAGTIVFDEVDAGIGGRVGHVVGARLRDLAAGRQVICVTHLAQIAARADAQFFVDKVIIDGRARVTVSRVERDTRLEELARMFGGGKPPTPATLKHAAELLETARREATAAV